MSAPKRFFVDKINYPEVTKVYLEGEEFIHAKTVLRVETGTEIVLLDGSGKEFSAIVADIEKKRLLAHITGVIDGDKEPTTPVYLLCGALKGDKTEFVVQKACELGVSKIGVFSSDYCSAYMNENKLERLRKVSREAAKQCLRSRAPEVEYFNGLEEALASAAEYENKLDGATVVVGGSEGGFSEREYEVAKQHGFSGISLGKRILRAETAAVAVCALVAFALGELK